MHSIPAGSSLPPGWLNPELSSIICLTNECDGSRPPYFDEDDNNYAQRPLPPPPTLPNGNADGTYGHRDPVGDVSAQQRELGTGASPPPPPPPPLPALGQGAFGHVDPSPPPSSSVMPSNGVVTFAWLHLCMSLHLLIGERMSEQMLTNGC